MNDRGLTRSDLYWEGRLARVHIKKQRKSIQGYVYFTYKGLEVKGKVVPYDKVRGISKCRV